MKLDLLNTHMPNQQWTLSALLVCHIAIWEHFHTERVQKCLAQTLEVKN